MANFETLQVASRTTNSPRTGDIFKIPTLLGALASGEFGKHGFGRSNCGPGVKNDLKQPKSSYFGPTGPLLGPVTLSVVHIFKKFQLSSDS